MTPRRRMRAVPARAHRDGTRRRLLTAAAAAGLAVLLMALTGQYANTYSLAREEARLVQRRHELIADNARLRDEIQRLQTDDRYIEQIAREQLGLVRPGEVELLVVPYDGTVSAPGTGRRDASVSGNGGGAAGTADGGSAAPAPQPRRGIGGWAAAVRDAVLRLVRTPRR